MLEAARKESGFTVLRQDAAAKLRGGLTSMEEASSVVQHA
jgi:hypothetical protein